MTDLAVTGNNCNCPDNDVKLICDTCVLWLALLADAVVVDVKFGCNDVVVLVNPTAWPTDAEDGSSEEEESDFPFWLIALNWLAVFKPKLIFDDDVVVFVLKNDDDEDARPLLLLSFWCKFNVSVVVVPCPDAVLLPAASNHGMTRDDDDDDCAGVAADAAELNLMETRQKIPKTPTVYHQSDSNTG